MKLYICADIEGTCGITDWAETEPGDTCSEYFRERMTREVAAACRGAFAAGFDGVTVKDAHDSARNLIPSLLPRGVNIIRGWPRDPLCMMSGVDRGFDAAGFTGCHNAASTGTNPLSHTMTTKVKRVVLNGEPISEFAINARIASYYGVPAAFVTGDAGLCRAAESMLPGIGSAAAFEGFGAGTLSPQPDDFCDTVERMVCEALSGDFRGRIFTAEKSYTADITYVRCGDAYSYSFYPGARLISDDTVSITLPDYYELLRFFHFVL